MTGPDSEATPQQPDPLEPEDDLPAPVEGPPGGGIFSLEGRRAPGLYLVAWLLTVGGLAVTFVLGPMASDSSARSILIFVGAIAVTVGLAAGAGAQVLERAARDPERYRGPSPLVVFGVYFFAMSLIGLVLIVGFDVDPEQPFNFLGIGIVQAAGYLLVVWLFALRTEALTWPQMGWPGWRGPSFASVGRGVLAAIGTMLPVTIGLLFVGGIVGLLLGVDAPQVLPLSETPIDGFLVAAAAAVILPVGEELFFRGFALTAWRRDLGDRPALIRSTLFFALVHIANIDTASFVEGLSQTVLTLAVILPVGWVLGWLFIRYGLLAAMAGHVTYNSLLLTLAFLASKLPEPEGLSAL